MDKSFEFRFIGKVPNFDALKNDVMSMTEQQWNKFTFRQKNIAGHKDTLSIPLIFDPINKTEFVTHEHYEKFRGHLEAISLYLSSIEEPHDIKRANIVLLKAKCFIKRHKDKGEFLEKTRRVHIPIATNDGCYLTVEETDKHFPEGEIWEIDNTGKYHSAHNEGNTDRIHLIIDIK